MEAGSSEHGQDKLCFAIIIIIITSTRRCGDSFGRAKKLCTVLSRSQIQSQFSHRERERRRGVFRRSRRPTCRILTSIGRGKASSRVVSSSSSGARTFHRQRSIPRSFFSLLPACDPGRCWPLRAWEPHCRANPRAASCCSARIQRPSMATAAGASMCSMTHRHQVMCMATLEKGSNLVRTASLLEHICRSSRHR